MNKKYYPSKNFHPFGWMPSIFDEMDEVMSFSNEKGLSVSEHDGSIFVEAAVPGLNPDDIEISFDKGVLWVKGSQTEEHEDKKKKYYKKASRKYSYCTTLPENTDFDSTPEATCKDGIVTITFAKKEVTEPKKIKVKTS